MHAKSHLFWYRLSLPATSLAALAICVALVAALDAATGGRIDLPSWVNTILVFGLIGLSIVLGTFFSGLLFAKSVRAKCPKCGAFMTFEEKWRRGEDRVLYSCEECRYRWSWKQDSQGLPPGPPG